MKKYSILSLYFFTILTLTACVSGGGAITPPASLGNPSAKVVIDEFSDFECPWCAVIAPQIKQIAERNSDFAQLNFYHFPLSYHPIAFLAAEAAECAHDQGKFWEFSEKAFQNQQDLSEERLKSIAKETGAEEGRFNACLDSHEKKEQIRSNLAEGKKRQLSYTPSVYVNGQLIQWESAEKFEAYVKSLK